MLLGYSQVAESQPKRPDTEIRGVWLTNLTVMCCFHAIAVVMLYTYAVELQYYLPYGFGMEPTPFTPVLWLSEL